MTDLDPMPTIFGIQQRAHDAALAAYRERIARLESVVTAQAEEIERLTDIIGDMAAAEVDAEERPS